MCLCVCVYMFFTILLDLIGNLDLFVEFTSFIQSMTNAESLYESQCKKSFSFTQHMGPSWSLPPPPPPVSHFSSLGLTQSY